MDRNMEKEWTGVTYSELLFTAFIIVSCFLSLILVIVHGAYYIMIDNKWATHRFFLKCNFDLNKQSSYSVSFCLFI